MTHRLLTNRVWLRILAHSAGATGVGFCSAAAAATLGAHPVGLWGVGAGILLLAVLAYAVLLLLRRRASKGTKRVQTHLDSVLPPVPTPAEIAARREEKP
jgi:hypothetical protein